MTTKVTKRNQFHPPHAYTVASTSSHPNVFVASLINSSLLFHSYTHSYLSAMSNRRGHLSRKIPNAINRPAPPKAHVPRERSPLSRMDLELLRQAEAEGKSQVGGVRSDHTHLDGRRRSKNSLSPV